MNRNSHTDPSQRQAELLKFQCRIIEDLQAEEYRINKMALDMALTIAFNACENAEVQVALILVPPISKCKSLASPSCSSVDAEKAREDMDRVRAIRIANQRLLDAFPWLAAGRRKSGRKEAYERLVESRGKSKGFY